MTEFAAIDNALDEINEIAADEDATIYNILRRNAGWGLQWFEEDRASKAMEVFGDLSDMDDWRSERGSMLRSERVTRGLVVYRYYDTFSEMLLGERARLLALKQGN